VGGPRIYKIHTGHVCVQRRPIRFLRGLLIPVTRESAVKIAFKGLLDVNKNSLVIRSINASELEMIEASFPSGDATKHQSRFDMQMQDGANYLFAWYQGVPIGHVLLRWNGTLDEPIASSLRDCPHVEDLFVQKDTGRRGLEPYCST